MFYDHQLILPNGWYQIRHSRDNGVHRSGLKGSKVVLYTWSAYGVHVELLRTSGTGTKYVTRTSNLVECFLFCNYSYSYELFCITIEVKMALRIIY